jgi:hypothetical protein
MSEPKYQHKYLDQMPEGMSVVALWYYSGTHNWNKIMNLARHLQMRQLSVKEICISPAAFDALIEEVLDYAGEQSKSAWVPTAMGIPIRKAETGPEGVLGVLLDSGECVFAAFPEGL